VGSVATGTTSPRPANDNTRRIFGLAAAAVAAAAALMIWGRMEPGPGGERSPVIAAQTAQTAPNAEVPAPSVEAPRSVDAQMAEPPRPEGDMEMGVEVAAVDFGAGSGSIFYVPRDSAGLGAATAMTTVVWLADDVGGGR
jgi:hypothetical protein